MDALQELREGIDTATAEGLVQRGMFDGICAEGGVGRGDSVESGHYENVGQDQSQTSPGSGRQVAAGCQSEGHRLEGATPYERPYGEQAARQLGRCSSHCREKNSGQEAQEAREGLGQAQQICMEKSKKKRASPKQLEELAYQQGERCALSGLPITPETADLDHITPLVNGGTNEISNLQWLHRSVHKCKGTLATEDFIAICVAVARNYRKDL
jgi:5-methylcytosine-specific restriction endonuclease McrA